MVPWDLFCASYFCVSVMAHEHSPQSLCCYAQTKTHTENRPETFKAVYRMTYINNAGAAS